MPNFSIEEIRRRYEEKRRQRRFPGNPTRSMTQEQLEYAHDSESYRPPPPPATSSSHVAVPVDYLIPAPDTSHPLPVPIGVIPGPSGNPSVQTGGGSGSVPSVNQGSSSSNQPLYTLGEQILRRNRQRTRQDDKAQKRQQSSQNVNVKPDYAEYESSESRSVAPVNIPATAAQRQHLEVLIGVEDDDNVRGVLIAILHEGIPASGFTEYYLSQFAHWGNDSDADTYTLELLERVRYSYWDESLSQEDLGNDLWVEAHARHTLLHDDVSAKAEPEIYRDSFEDYKEHVELIYGVQFTSDEGADAWDLIGVRMVHIELENVARESAERLRAMTDLSMDDATAFRLIFGDITLKRSAETRLTTKGKPVAAEVSGHTITIYRKQGHNRNYHLQPYLFLHELGHVFNTHAGQGKPWGYGSITWDISKNPAMQSRAGMGWPREDILLDDNLVPTDFQEDLHPRPLMPLHEYLGLEADDPLITETDLDPMDIQLLQHSREYSNNEIAADTYLNWIVHMTTDGDLGFSPDSVDPAGQERLDFMNESIDERIRNAIFYNAADDPHVERFLKERGALLSIAGSGTVETEDDVGAVVRSGPSKTAEIVRSLGEGSAVTLLARTQDFGDDNYHWNAVEDSGVYWMGYDVVTENWSGDMLILSKEQASATFNPGRPYEETAEWFRELVRFLLARR